MESNDQDIITPGGMHSGVNPPATAASGTRILEVPTTMSEEMSLSEEDRLLGEDTLPKDKPGKRVHSAEDQAVMRYKNRLRKAKFYVEKANKRNLSHEVPSEYQLRSDGWALEIIAKEDERKESKLSIKAFCCPASTAAKRNRSQDDIALPPGKRVQEPSTSSFRSHRDNASRGTPKATHTEKRRHEHASSTPSTSKAKDEAKNRLSLKPVVRNIDKLPFNEIVKLNLKVSIVDANAADLKMNVNNFSLVEKFIQKEMFKLICEKESASIAFQMKERYKGFRIINCETEESLMFLKSTVSKMGELWPNAKLEVRHLNQLSSGPTVKINLPMSEMDAKLITGLLMLNNKDLPIKNWKLIAYGNSFEGRIPVRFRVDEESVAMIEKKGCEINFGIRSVMVKISKSNLQSEKEVEEVSVDEIQKDTDIDISTLFNEGLELDKDAEGEK